ncbi:MAG: hypothetical protein AABZ06_00810 [Bdellovibrionota bacterium]
MLGNLLYLTKTFFKIATLLALLIITIPTLSRSEDEANTNGFATELEDKARTKIVQAQLIRKKACDTFPFTDELKSAFLNYITTTKRSMEASLGKNDSTTGLLYNLQSSTSTILELFNTCADTYAFKNSLNELFSELLNLYLSAITPQHLTKIKLPGGSSVRTFKGAVNILDTSQFFFTISKVFHILAKNKNLRGNTEKRFINEFSTLLLGDHMRRHLFGPETSFRNSGWGCKLDGKRTLQNNHFNFIKVLRDRKNGDNLSYCNVVTDLDLWFIASAANILLADEVDHNGLFPTLSKSLRSDLIDYVKLGASLINSRVSMSKVTDQTTQKKVLVANFDLDSWWQHPDYRCAKYLKNSQEPDKLEVLFPNPYPHIDCAADRLDLKHKKNKYPTGCLPVNTNADSVQAFKTGWDVSHAAGRLTNAFDAMYELRNFKNNRFKLAFPSNRQMQAFAAQVGKVVYNNNKNYPVLSTFMDGTNGWFRIHYSNRPQFGYPPGAFTIVAHNFAPWQVYDPSIRDMIKAIHAKRMAGDQVNCETTSSCWVARYEKTAFKINNDYFESYCSNKSSEHPQFTPATTVTPAFDWWASLLGICSDHDC